MRRRAGYLMLSSLASICLFAALSVVYSTRSHANTEPSGYSDTLTNSMCPVLPDEAVDPEVFTTYRDKQVCFCCPKCRRTFLEDPEKYLSNLPQFGGSENAALDLGARGALTVDAGHSHSEANDKHAEAEEPGHERHEHEGGDDDAREESQAESGLESSGHQHDHATGHGEAEGLDRFVRFVGKFHPVVIHFPIALLLGAALAELIAQFCRPIAFGEIGHFCLWLGALGAIVAAPLGWAAAAHARYPADLVQSLWWHRWMGTITAVLAVITVVVAEVARKKPVGRLTKVYRILIFLIAGLVSVTGHFGATLIYGAGYFKF